VPITSNKVESFARACITFTCAVSDVIDGAVTISAADQTGIDAHSGRPDVTTTNTTGLADLVGATIVKSDSVHDRPGTRR
jgi:hypothetical protein